MICPTLPTCLSLPSYSPKDRSYELASQGYQWFGSVTDTHNDDDVMRAWTTRIVTEEQFTHVATVGAHHIIIIISDILPLYVPLVLLFLLVAMIAWSYYKGERAMIDCTQEYEERAYQKKMRELERRRAAGLPDEE